jgi:hypothetical protein
MALAGVAREGMEKISEDHSRATFILHHPEGNYY